MLKSYAVMVEEKLLDPVFLTGEIPTTSLVTGPHVTLTWLLKNSISFIFYSRLSTVLIIHKLQEK